MQKRDFSRLASSRNKIRQLAEKFNVKKYKSQLNGLLGYRNGYFYSMKLFTSAVPLNIRLSPIWVRLILKIDKNYFYTSRIAQPFNLSLNFGCEIVKLIFS